MEFRYSEEQRLFKDSIRDFCEKEVAPLAQDIERGKLGILEQ